MYKRQVWDILAEMAEREGRTTNALISLFHDEIMSNRGEVPNFASFLRVTCMRYLRRVAHTADSAAEGAAGQAGDPGAGAAPARLAVVAAGAPR